MLRSIFSLLILTFVLGSYAQTTKPKVTKGPISSDPYFRLWDLPEEGITGLHQGKFFAYKFKRERSKNAYVLSLREYSAESKPQRKREIKIKDDRPYKLVDLLLSQGKLYLIVAGENRQTRALQLFAQEIDPTDLSTTGKLKKIGEIPKAIGLKTPSQIELVLSIKKEKVLIWTTTPPDRLDPYNQPSEIPAHALVFDAALNLLWSAALPDWPKGFSKYPAPPSIDDKGRVTVLYQTYKKKSGSEALIYVYDQGKEQHLFKLKSKDKLSHLAISSELNDQLICAGFYKSDPAGYDGTFCQTFDLISGSSSPSKSSPFSAAMFEKLYPPKTFNGKMDNLRSGKLILRQDGSLVLIMQRTYSIGGNRTPEGTPTTIFQYFEDLMMASINAQKEVEWVERIKMVAHPFSFNLILLPEMIGFVRTYESESKALKPGLVKKLGEFNGSPPTNMGIDFVSISHQGEKEIQSLVPADGKGHAVNRFIIQDGKTVVVMANQSNRNHFLRLEF